MTKQIDIKELIPFIEDGYVACDKSGLWHYFIKTPAIQKCSHCGYAYEWNSPESEKHALLPIFNIKPAKDWTKSLIKVGGK